MVRTDNLHQADYAIIVIYFVAVIFVGLWSSLKNRRGGVSGYFLAGRSMNWFLIGGSLYGSNIGTEHFIGLSGSGAVTGLVVAGFELQGMFTLILLGWLFLPVYISSEVYTMPEYLKKRFGGRRIRSYLAALTLFLSIIVKTSVDLFSGSIFIKKVLGWNLYGAIGLQLAIAGISTLGGGLTAVMWTDTMQVMLLIVGAFIVMVLGFNEVGGYNSMVDRYFKAIPSANATIPGFPKCAGYPDQYAMHLLKPMDADIPWTAITFGIIGNSIWYWCCDQVIVQKALAGKNYTHSKGGCLMTGFLKFLPMWMMVFPGMISRILYTDEVACTNPEFCDSACGSPRGCSNIAYPLLVIRLLPAGARGILIAVMMAAIMSNVTSTFNSCSTIFTMDVYHTFKKKATQLELLIVGRGFIVLMIVTSIVWIPIIEAFPSSQLINYVQSVQSYMGPPICAIFVLGIFVPRVNEQVHYLHFGLISLISVTCVTLIISWVTKPLPRTKTDRLTFWTRRHPKPLEYAIKDHKSDAINLKQGADEISSSSSPDVILNQTSGENGYEKCHENNVATIATRSEKVVSVLHFVCGTVDENEPEGQKAAAKNVITLDEKLEWKRFCDILALCLVSFAIFVYVFWA
uniref:Uncharacterized protein n=1 Tax=Romanomermis culicivorax TaxID=13658 RepID=A0A915K4G8_ROMCU